jgi:hypothetical protein
MLKGGTETVIVNPVLSLQVQSWQMKTEPEDSQSRCRRRFQADMCADEAMELADHSELGTEEETAVKIRDLRRLAAELLPWKYGEPEPLG